MLLGGDPATGGSCGGTLLTYHPTMAHDATVTCTPVAGSDAVQPGVGGPANALLTLARRWHRSSAAAGTIKTTGNVFSDSSISLGGTVTSTPADYAITAKGVCSPTPNPDPTASLHPWLAVNTQCNAPATVPQINDGKIRSPPTPATPAGSPRCRRPKFNPCPTCLGQDAQVRAWQLYRCPLLRAFELGGHAHDDLRDCARLVRRHPQQRDLLRARCLLLQLLHRFDRGHVRLAERVHVDDRLCGESTPGRRWRRQESYDGNAAPTITADGTNGAPTNCVGGKSADGVQFILGGASAISMGQSGQMELCPKTDGNGFGISIIGLNSSQPGIGGTTSSSARTVPTSAVAPAGTAAQVAPVRRALQTRPTSRCRASLRRPPSPVPWWSPRR